MNAGILNAILLQLGLADRKVVWLGDPGIALHMILVADAWKAIPFVSLLLLAGLQGIPGHLYRAARVDGAGAWARFRHVTLPGLRVPILVAVDLQSIWALKVFDLVYVLTKGGPIDSTVVLNFLAWRVTFNFLDVGYGAAIANDVWGLQRDPAMAEVMRGVIFKMVCSGKPQFSISSSTLLRVEAWLLPEGLVTPAGLT